VTPDERLLTPNEVAERLALSPVTVLHMLRAGTLPGQKVGTLWRTPVADLDAYIRAGSEAAAAKREARAVAARRKAAGLSPKPHTKPSAPRKPKAKP
jgi:excisionase family DNA binding protein